MIASHNLAFPFFLHRASMTLAGFVSQTGDWSPPPHSAPGWARLSDPVVLLVALLAHHPFVTGFSMIPIVIGLGKLFPSLTGDRSNAIRQRRVIIGSMVAFSVTNLLLGTSLANALIYWTGEAASATITGQHSTGSVYNNRFIGAYDVAIRTASGRMLTSRFHSDDFNAYPSHNLTLYPGVGSRFTVRYLRLAPSEFVIIENDDSPFSRGLRSRTEDRTF